MVLRENAFVGAWIRRRASRASISESTAAIGR